jgi:hypothetical protein
MEEEESYELINDIIEQAFIGQDLIKDVFYKDIPDSLTSLFNESLDFDFRENIEYLLFYNDSLDKIGEDGISIVKKRDKYYLILKEHRKKPIIFFLYSKFEQWHINSFSLNRDNYNITIVTKPDANVINGEDFYSIDGEEYPEFPVHKLYVFKFYNMVFLELLIEICERINDELD